MVQLTYPGVYIREVPSGARTITGVATSIAAFVGMAKSGQVNVPTLALSFRDYVRAYSEDTSLGEMTDQVRQFFLNGGQQAYVVRVANNAVASSVTLPLAGGAQLILTALSEGFDGDRLRVTVDYNTANPESTFNLTIFRERTDQSGNVTIDATETHSNLSLDAAAARYVVNVVANNSQLVRASTTGTLTRNDSASISAFTGADADALGTALFNLLPAGLEKRTFRIRVGDRSGLISVNQGDVVTGAAFFAAFASHINGSLNLPAGTLVASAQAFAGLVVLHFTAKMVASPNTELDVVIDRGLPDTDLAIELGIGVGQGGIERTVFADSRPAPNGLVSKLSDTGDFDLLGAFAQTTKAPWLAVGTVLELGGANMVTVDGADVSFPVQTGSQSLLEGTVAGSSLLNLRENLQSIVEAFNSKTTVWQARLSGYRIALRFTPGPASGGANHEFTTGPATFTAMFDPPTSVPVGTPFLGGMDGDPPLPTDYQDAFDELEKVDLVNIIVLPKSRDDTMTPGDRFAVWGSASVFAQKRRAFLLLDAPNEVETVVDATGAVGELRSAGIVNDHAAFYWPRVRVNPDGNPRFIDASGSIAGIMARTDASRGVWKAPAGLEANLRAVLGVQVSMSDAENGLLNPLAVNAIRSFPNGIVSWGARTLDGFDNSGNDDYKYVPVRRFALFLEESLFRGLKFAVFEPNDEPLWGQIRLAAGAFMNNLFRLGAFQGRSPREAYFVKCDSETTTQNDINLGIVNVLVGFAPLKPAEFVVITIQQLAGQVQV